MPSWYHLVINQMLAALEYLTDHKIVHGDLKPENILCNDTEEFYIADFGFAHKEGEGNGVYGTEEFMAPEVWKGRMEIRSDVWSLGIIGLDILGRLPPELEGQPDVPRWMRDVAEKARSAPPEIQEMLQPSVRRRKFAGEIARARPLKQSKSSISTTSMQGTISHKPIKPQHVDQNARLRRKAETHAHRRAPQPESLPIGQMTINPSYGEPGRRKVTESHRSPIQILSPPRRTIRHETAGQYQSRSQYPSQSQQEYATEPLSPEVILIKPQRHTLIREHTKGHHNPRQPQSSSPHRSYLTELRSPAVKAAGSSYREPESHNDQRPQHSLRPAQHIVLVGPRSHPEERPTESYHPERVRMERRKTGRSHR